MKKLRALVRPVLTGSCTALAVWLVGLVVVYIMGRVGAVPASEPLCTLVLGLPTNGAAAFVGMMVGISQAREQRSFAALVLAALFIAYDLFGQVFFFGFGRDQPAAWYSALWIGGTLLSFFLFGRSRKGIISIEVLR